jgi:glycosyltransferase involved in cell wall biosynthesis
MVRRIAAQAIREAVRRLLLVTHRDIGAAGGPTARWRSLARRLPEHGWEVDVLAAPVRPSASEFGEDPAGLARAQLRAQVMGAVGRAAEPAFGLAGVRPEALPLSMLWMPRGAAGVVRRVRRDRPDAVLATGPPVVALLAARLAASVTTLPPLGVELRDLWAGSDAFDRGGPVLGAIEGWVFRRARAVVACTPEAVADLRARHPEVAERVVEIPNGFEPELLTRRNGRPHGSPGPQVILHSGTLTRDRPLRPLLRVLGRPAFRGRFRLVLHGHLAPASRAELAEHPDVDVEVLAPTAWADAVERIRDADIALLTQAARAGDATAVASKVYEYLALGRPVLGVTDGGATEALLRRLGAAELCARLDDEEGIAAALERAATAPPPPLEPSLLRPYDRGEIAARMAELLDELAG